MKLVTNAITSNVDVLVSNPRKVLRVDKHHFKPVPIMKPHTMVVKTGLRWKKRQHLKLRLTNMYVYKLFVEVPCKGFENPTCLKGNVNKGQYL